MLRLELDELRKSIEQHRRDSLDRCTGLLQEFRIHRGQTGGEDPVDLPVFPSPPHTRSRGRAVDLPLVQSSVLEWRKGL